MRGNYYMDRRKCIYCGTAEDLSDSDIIPDALTAARIINKCVCHVEHNSGMTEKFEAEVAKKLAFLLNHLNIKSKKSNHLPSYEADYVIAGVRYHDKNVIKKHDFLNRKILWDEERNAAFGPYEKVKKIAQSKNGKEKDVKQIDINTQIIESHIPLNVDVFFGEAMHRQVAKIAYEWYCLKNKIEDRYNDFSEIIDYILNGNNDQVVKLVTDETLLGKFQFFCNSGSHCIMAYIDSEGGISTLVDMFGVAVYDVKVCNHIPDFCFYNCALQKINIDGTGNRENECLCIHDYNDLIPDMLVGIKENEEFPEKKCGELVLKTMTSVNKHVEYNIFVMEIQGSLDSGVKGVHGGNDIVVKFVLHQLNELLNLDIIHKRGIVRFVEENIGDDEIAINEKNISQHDIFYYYVLYKLGENEIEELNDEIIQQFIINLFGSGHIDSKEIDISGKLREMVQCEKHNELIKKGAEKIRKW